MLFLFKALLNTASRYFSFNCSLKYQDLSERFVNLILFIVKTKLS